jgi:predicted O-methyltransferase YrrM
MSWIPRSLVPKSVRRRILDDAARALGRKRSEEESAMPNALLGAEHVDGCRVLLNREALLAAMEKGAVAAEIGVFRGDFSARILQVAAPARLHLVDSWDPSRVDPGMAAEVAERFAEETGRGEVVIHRKPSVEAAAGFPDSYFDWIYLDSDHSYGTTRDELAAYAGKVKDGGIIAGHDYSMGNWAAGLRYGVVEAVHEFCLGSGWKLVYITAEPGERQSFAITRIR